MEKVNSFVKKVAPHFVTSLGGMVASFAVGTFVGAEYGIVAAYVLALTVHDKSVSYLQERLK